MPTQDDILSIVTDELNANPTAVSHGADAAIIAQAVWNNAQTRNTDPVLALAHMKLESSFDPMAYKWENNKLGASIGLMQVLIDTARGYGFSGAEGDLMDQATNIYYGIWYMSDVQKQYGFEGGIIAYNAGHVVYTTDTTAYLNLVKKYYDQYQAKIGGTTSSDQQAAQAPAPANNAGTVIAGIVLGFFGIFAVNKLTKK